MGQMGEDCSLYCGSSYLVKSGIRVQKIYMLLTLFKIGLSRQLYALIQARPRILLFTFSRRRAGHWSRQSNMVSLLLSHAGQQESSTLSMWQRAMESGKRRVDDELKKEEALELSLSVCVSVGVYQRLRNSSYSLSIMCEAWGSSSCSSFGYGSCEA